VSALDLVLRELVLPAAVPVLPAGAVVVLVDPAGAIVPGALVLPATAPAAVSVCML
jgi:hypothetical protein